MKVKVKGSVPEGVGPDNLQFFEGQVVCGVARKLRVQILWISGTDPFRTPTSSETRL